MFAVEHYGGLDGHLKQAFGILAKFGAAPVFFDAYDAAGAPDGKAESATNAGACPFGVAQGQVDGRKTT